MKKTTYAAYCFKMGFLLLRTPFEVFPDMMDNIAKGLIGKAKWLLRCEYAQIHRTWADIYLHIAKERAMEFFLDPLLGFPRNILAGIRNLLGKKTYAPAFHVRSCQSRKREYFKTYGVLP